MMGTLRAKSFLPPIQLFGRFGAKLIPLGGFAAQSFGRSSDKTKVRQGFGYPRLL